MFFIKVPACPDNKWVNIENWFWSLCFQTSMIRFFFEACAKPVTSTFAMMYCGWKVPLSFYTKIFLIIFKIANVISVLGVLLNTIRYVDHLSKSWNSLFDMSYQLILNSKHRWQFIFRTLREKYTTSMYSFWSLLVVKNTGKYCALIVVEIKRLWNVRNSVWIIFRKIKCYKHFIFQ